ncbi:Pyrrolocin cluster transcription factor fsdR [Colletotrichum siamense]|uniref:Pyrrolocin cluster transcription factor fsdR n=1 Tax=Colletotrichum siamense TaxID=690259 RepID=UPI001872E1E9|nr:Pyrrolocin cluster transcription factor fsdR [Colletotrichum siamense]KAF5492521.1 Pyrrolocin cluster transcription factor fsdR [Colletotrichum siamense]
MADRGTPLRYRKNGRIQACDPCRRRKVVCDHARPICGSCRRRRKAGTCEYTAGSPARMQSPSTPAPDPGQLGPPTSDGVPEQHLTGSTAVEQPTQTDQSAAGHDHINSSLQTVNPEVTSSGHLGFNSFGDIYREVGDSLSDHDNRAAGTSRTDGATVGSNLITPSNCITELPPSTTTLETCLFVLQSIPTEDKGQALFAAHFDPHDAFVRPVAQRALDSLYATYGSYLGTVRDDAQLSELTRILCANTAKPFSENEADPEKWVAQFTGTNVRWETLGILYIYWELSSRNNHLVRPETKPPPPGGRVAAFRQRDVYRKCINDCQALARRATEVGNTLLLYVYWKRTIVASIVSGDTSLSCWMYNGEAVSLMTFLGLHVNSTKGVYKPTLASEIKRRLVYKIFVIDKVVSSITGRPPLLSRRYMLTPPPLDLKDDYLVADEETLSRAVASLDSNGYNTDGAAYSITFWRARAQLMIIRDEIFEISLGVEGATSAETLYALKNRELQAAADMPSVLQFREADVRDPDVSTDMLYPRILMRLEHLQNLFFIERLLRRHGCANEKDLLAVSYDLTTTTMLFWTNMDGLAMVYEDFKWLVMAYAAPGGGILCLELLKPTVTLNEPNGITSANGESVTRSSIVQLLSLLVGFLNWVSPKEANGNICANCKIIVQRVLDQVLNVAPNRDGPLADFLEWDFSTHLDFNFDLLDTFEWTRPEFSWTDLPP